MGEMLRRRVRIAFEVEVVVNDLTPEEVSELVGQDRNEAGPRFEWVQRQMRLLRSVLADEEATDAVVIGQAMQAVFYFADQGLDIEADEVQNKVLLAHAEQMEPGDAEFFATVRGEEDFHLNTVVLQDRFQAEVVRDSWVKVPPEGLPDEGVEDRPLPID